MKKEEIMTKATQMLSKTAFKLKKASPTIMVVGAAIGGVTATVLACKATLKAQYILAEHKANMEKIHETKDKVDSGEIQLSEGETYTKEDLAKDITTTYIKTGMKLAKVYAPAIGLGAASLGCMFGSHHIMTKRNATLTAAYIALEQSFNGYIPYRKRKKQPWQPRRLLRLLRFLLRRRPRATLRAQVRKQM